MTVLKGKKELLLFIIYHHHHHIFSYRSWIASEERLQEMWGRDGDQHKNIYKYLLLESNYECCGYVACM